MVTDAEQLNPLLAVALAEAEGDSTQTDYLMIDPEAWRRALVDLLDETRSELAALNAERKKFHPRLREHKELTEERAGFCERQRMLDTRLRYVKNLVGPRKPTYDGSELEQLRAHAYEMLDLVASLESRVAEFDVVEEEQT